MNARLQTPPSAAFILNADSAISQIALHLPGATAVLQRLDIDSCCGGGISLAQATSNKGLDLQAVLTELGHLQPVQVQAKSACCGACGGHSR